MNEMTLKWIKTGLLDGLKDNQMDEAAAFLNETATYLLSIVHDPHTPEEEQFCGIIIPAARRIYEEIEASKHPTPKWLVDDCWKYFQEKKDLIKDFNSYIAMDGEAQFTNLYCDDVMSRL